MVPSDLYLHRAYACQAWGTPTDRCPGFARQPPKFQTDPAGRMMWPSGCHHSGGNLFRRSLCDPRFQCPKSWLEPYPLSLCEIDRWSHHIQQPSINRTAKAFRGLVMEPWIQRCHMSRSHYLEELLQKLKECPTSHRALRIVRTQTYQPSTTPNLPSSDPATDLATALTTTTTD